MTSRASLTIALLLLGVGCDSKKDAIAEATRFVEGGCCGNVDVTGCKKCPDWDGAKVTSASAENGCASSCWMVSLGVQTAKGERHACTFAVMKDGPEDRRVTGGVCSPGH